MTAEIAILNRSAVALAADSAVTVGSPGQQKIYNAVDKLFHLCVEEPVGVMIFGGAEFMGVPIETVIKKFRHSALCEPKKTLKEYSATFFQYLEKEIPVPPELAMQNIEGIVSEAFGGIWSRALDRYMRSATSNGNQTDAKAFLEETLANMGRARISVLEKRADNVAFDETEPANRDLIEKALKGSLGIPPSPALVELFNRFAGLIVRKDAFSNGAMGLVFAGFGTDEMFPKLEAFHSDGLIGDRVKRRQFRYVDIKRSGDGAGARIEAFAQKEMVDRFLDGIDPSFESYLRSAMKEALNDLGNEVLQTFVRTSKAKKAQIAEKISEAANKYLQDFATKSDQRKEDNYRRRILDMVHFMPKSDLANMAESLINLTSTKRRVSAESETVGGPIDVAVISKYDGFVWIKRKHYFSRELNPRYFTSHHM